MKEIYRFIIISIIISSLFIYTNNKSYEYGYQDTKRENIESFHKGLQEGFDKGFISGDNYGQGKLIKYYQNQNFDVPHGLVDNNGKFTEKTNFYYKQGYNFNRTYLNPFMEK